MAPPPHASRQLNPPPAPVVAVCSRGRLGLCRLTISSACVCCRGSRPGGPAGAATRGRRVTGKGLGRGDNSAPPGRRLLERQWRLGASFVYIDQHRVTLFYGGLTQAGSRSQLRINYFKKIKTNSHCTQTEEINISSCTSTLYCPSSNRNIYYYLFYASRISPNRLPHFSLH